MAFARYIAARPELLHVRTRYRSPQTNGVIERFYQAIKYEHLYRREIGDGLVLAQEVASYLTVYNSVRPHEAIGFATPLTRYLQVPSTPKAPTFHRPELSQILDAGQAQVGRGGACAAPCSPSGCWHRWRVPGLDSTTEGRWEVSHPIRSRVSITPIRAFTR